MNKRCDWAERSSLEQDYHDLEWGVPIHDDRKLFEFLILEGSQAGLSWATILRKRNGYRIAFDGFDPAVVARYDEAKRLALLSNGDIVRNKLKISAAIGNAAAYLNVQEAFESFDRYLWGFVDGKPIQNAWRSMEQVPASTPESDAMSRDLKQRGFKFVGTTICYALMQAVGLVNDHTSDCFRHREVRALGLRGA